MNNQDFNEDQFVPSGSENVGDSFSQNAQITGIVNQAHTVNTLHFIAGISQIFLSLSVVFLSVLGLIQPIWLSTVLSMVASVSAMVGLYFLYTVAYQHNDPNRLLREAMQRVMRAKN